MDYYYIYYKNNVTSIRHVVRRGTKSVDSFDRQLIRRRVACIFTSGQLPIKEGFKSARLQTLILTH